MQSFSKATIASGFALENIIRFNSKQLVVSWRKFSINMRSWKQNGRENGLSFCSMVQLSQALTKTTMMTTTTSSGLKIRSMWSCIRRSIQSMQLIHDTQIGNRWCPSFFLPDYSRCTVLRSFIHCCSFVWIIYICVCSCSIKVKRISVSRWPMIHSLVR